MAPPPSSNSLADASKSDCRLNAAGAIGSYVGNRKETSLAIDELDNLRTRVDRIVPLFIDDAALFVAFVSKFFTVVFIDLPGVEVDDGRCGEFWGVSEKTHVSY